MNKDTENKYQNYTPESHKMVLIPDKKQGRGIIRAINLLFIILIGLWSVQITTAIEEPLISDNLYVSGVSIEPAEFFTGDQGIVTYLVTNGNDNQSISVNHGRYSNKDITLISGTYDSSSIIGPQQVRPYSFTVHANSGEGTYYPSFSLSLCNAGTINYQSPVKINNKELLLTVINQPDSYSMDKKESIEIQVANPRGNEVKNVILSVTGQGIISNPEKQYLGSILPGNETRTTTYITPNHETTLNITVSYSNGDNQHTVSSSIPITFTDDKKQASPRLSNIRVSKTDGLYHVNGDITNAGLTTANGVTITSQSPAIPEDPYRSYVIGSLKTDDFGSFEICFRTNNSTSVPLKISFKDEDGNIISSNQAINLNNSTEVLPQDNEGSFIPVIAVLIVLAVCGCGYIIYTRRIRR